ncbi:MAG: transglutaminase domain-containing protein [Chloroflexi bacterium]|nr:transglutaminase domain-containing protein [Chloroflexota bacterium]
MKKTKILVILTSVLLAGLGTTHYVSATPSADFHETDGEVFDDWGVFRTRVFGEDGFYQLSETTFRPAIAFESLGEEAALAYSLGEQIATQYPNQIQRAEAVFRFVRDRVTYTPDIDQFGYDEFALNADELAITIDQDGIGYGDCEDSAVLLAVMYKGAGYRSAIALGDGHTAALVYLPDYNKATAVFELDGEPGWVWAEATGKNNPLGWVPKEFINTRIAAYEVGEETIVRQEPATEPATAIAPKTGGTYLGPSPFLGIIVFLWLMPLFRRRRRVHYRR